MMNFLPRGAGQVLWCILLVSLGLGSPALASIRNVTTYGAVGNGTNDDTSAINSAIAALVSGDELYFPCPSANYRITGNLSTITKSNITIAGQTGCSNQVTIKFAGSANGGDIFTFGSNSLGSAISLSSTANELSTSFTTSSSLNVTAGDYVYIHQGGINTSTGGTDPTQCDASTYCRGETLQVAAVSGNTVTVATALHDTYTTTNAAVAQKLLSPTTGLTVQNITLDGGGLINSCVVNFHLVNATYSGYTAKNCPIYGFYANTGYNLSLSNVTSTPNSTRSCGLCFYNQGHLSVTTASISGTINTPLLIGGSADGTVTNVTVDGSASTGRTTKLDAVRYFTFNSLTVQNEAVPANGISIEYFSSHNTFNNCVVSNNGGTGTGTGSAGINLFGNNNQYNTFNNCTVRGNGNVQFVDGSGNNYPVSGTDTNNTINGGTYTGTNNSSPVIIMAAPKANVAGATISGPGPQGLLLQQNAANSCVNNNTFITASGLSSGISSNSTTNIGSGNVLNGYSSNLTAGTCGVSGGGPTAPTGVTAVVN